MSYRPNTYQLNRDNFEKSKDTDGFRGWRKAQYKAQNGHCAWCYEKVEYKDMDVDHIVPLARSRNYYNLNDFSNLVLSCHECNRDIKKDTVYNEVAYQNTLNSLSDEDKQRGYAPKKIYWERPEWIGPNKYCDKYKDYVPKDTPLDNRNVWQQKSPLIMDGSLKQPEHNYQINKLKNNVSDNSDAIWQAIKWILIIGGILFIIYIASTINSNKPSTITTKHCDYECQERAREQYEAEERKKQEAEKQEEWEEAKRWRACKAAGGSDEDCA